MRTRCSRPTIPSDESVLGAPRYVIDEIYDKMEILHAYIERKPVTYRTTDMRNVIAFHGVPTDSMAAEASDRVNGLLCEVRETIYKKVLVHFFDGYCINLEICRRDAPDKA